MATAYTCPLGVFSPLRGEYLDLLSSTALPTTCQTAWDIGTGSEPYWRLILQPGINIDHITATDTSPVPFAAAAANFARPG